ncbi:MAG: ATP-binding protein [Ferruginibacter sp.]
MVGGIRKIMLILVLFICFLGIGKHGISQSTVVQAIADLRGVDFSKSTVKLNGEWAFYWKQLIQPGNIPASSTGFIPFPSIWNDQTINGQVLSAEGFASYKATLILPTNHPKLSITMPDVYCAHRLYCNDSLIAQNGTVDSIAKNYIPQWLPQTVLLPVEKDTITLVLQIANYSHAKGGIVKDIIVGKSSFLELNDKQDFGSDFLLAGCLFMGGLFFFGLYLFGKNDKATLYFSLFSMLYSYRIVGSFSYALHSIYPNFNWNLAVRLEYFTLYGSVFLFLQYVRNLYPNDFYKPLMKLLSFCCLIICASPIVATTDVFTSFINPFLIAMFFCVLYILIIFITAIRKRRLASQYALSSIIILCFVVTIINLEYFGIAIPSRLIVFFGYASFFFLQSLILSYRFAYTFKKARRQAEQGLKAKSEFLSTMSHEIRTPLNSVIGMSHLLLKQDPREDQKERLNVLLFSANNLLTIVNDILDYNKIEAGKIKFEHIEMDIRSIVYNIISGFKTNADDKGIGLRLQIDEKLKHKVIGDPTRLSQVITNLVHNAIKFTKHGEVVVSIHVETTSTETITLTTKVTDTGIGIPFEKQQLIFEQFSQADSSTSRSYGGTGLGLSITKAILALQGCILKLESEPDKGSVFYFTQTYPVSHVVETATTEMSSLPDESEKPLSGIVILLVEDNLINVMVAKSFLERWGATIDVAENGKIAIDLLDVNRHALILMDMHMPVMDGYEATKLIRQQGIQIPIIALTASLPKDKDQDVRKAGIDDIVIKPFVPDELYRKVLHYLAAGSKKD